jgi:hypothetical protein
MKGDNWIYADNMLYLFTKIIKHKDCNVYVSPFINSRIAYLVEKDGLYSHCKTIKQGLLDIEFKKNGGDVSEFENLTLDDKLTYNKAIIMYRSITRACSGGTNYFLDNNNFSENKKYSIREIIENTKGQWGHDRLVRFFKLEELK